MGRLSIFFVRVFIMPISVSPLNTSTLAATAFAAEPLLQNSDKSLAEQVHTVKNSSLSALPGTDVNKNLSTDCGYKMGLGRIKSTPFPLQHKLSSLNNSSSTSASVPNTSGPLSGPKKRPSK